MTDLGLYVTFSVSEDGEERSMIEPQSREDPRVQELMKVMLDVHLTHAFQ